MFLSFCESGPGDGDRDGGDKAHPLDDANKPKDMIWNGYSFNTNIGSWPNWSSDLEHRFTCDGEPNGITVVSQETPFPVRSIPKTLQAAAEESFAELSKKGLEERDLIQAQWFVAFLSSNICSNFSEN